VFVLLLLSNPTRGSQIMAEFNP